MTDSHLSLYKTGENIDINFNSSENDRFMNNGVVNVIHTEDICRKSDISNFRVCETDTENQSESNNFMGYVFQNKKRDKHTNDMSRFENFRTNNSSSNDCENFVRGKIDNEVAHLTETDLKSKKFKLKKKMFKIFKCKICGWASEEKKYVLFHTKIHSVRKLCKKRVGRTNIVEKRELNKVKIGENIETEKKSKKGNNRKILTKVKKRKEKGIKTTIKKKKILKLSSKRKNKIAKRKTTKIFECKLCNYSSSYKSSLTRHQSKHSESKPFKCSTCDFATSQKCDIKKHMRIHTDERPFKCDECDYAARRKTTLRDHKLIHMKEKPFKCELCEYTVRIEKRLRAHMKTHTGSKDFKCDLCEFETFDKSSLTRHLLIHEGVKPFKCELCDYSARQKGTLTEHLKWHAKQKNLKCHSIGPFKCIFCSFYSDSKEALSRHRKVHKDVAKFRCTVCSKFFLTKGELYTHFKTHPKELPFGCDLCNYAAKKKTTLNDHKMIHFKRKLFECPFCEFSSRLRRRLVSHLKTNCKGEFINRCSVPYKCDKCEYNSNVKEDLIPHMATHYGRNSKIQISAMLLQNNENYGDTSVANVESNGSLKYESKYFVPTVDRPFKCQICDISFRQKAHLQNHFKIHTGERPFNCHLCDYAARRKCTLQKHMNLHNAEKPFKRRKKYSNENKAIAQQNDRQTSLLEVEDNVMGHTYSNAPENYFNKTVTAVPVNENPAVFHNYTNKVNSSQNYVETFCSKTNENFQELKALDEVVNEEWPPDNSPVQEEQNVSIPETEKEVLFVNRPYKCQFCTLAFTQSGHLKNHTKTHTDERPFQCQFCEYAARRKSTLQKHIHLHDQEKPFKCTDCTYSSKQQRDLSKHININHTSKIPTVSQPPPVTSKPPAVILNSLLNKAPHRLSGSHPPRHQLCTPPAQPPTHRLSTPPVQPSFHPTQMNFNRPSVENSHHYFFPKKYTNVYYDQQYQNYSVPYNFVDQHSNSVYHIPNQNHFQPHFDNNTAFVFHLAPQTVIQNTCNFSEYEQALVQDASQYVREEIVADDVDKSTKKVSNGNESKSKTGNSDEKNEYVEYADIVQDQTNETKEVYKCKLCKSFCIGKSALKKHLNRHNNPIKCSLCGYSTFTKAKLIIHSKTSHPEQKPFKCHICKRAYLIKRNLLRHLKKHSKYKCNECEFTAQKRSQLIEHVKTHTDEKKVFKCKTCEYVTFSNTEYRNHLQEHMKERPFKCDECSYGSHDKKILRKHILIKHSKSFTCVTCGYVSKYKACYLDHLKTHSKDKPFKCDQCDYACIQKRHLERHKKRHIEGSKLICDLCKKYKTETKANLIVHVKFCKKNKS